MIILGISAYYHDSAVALLENGQIKAAAQEERFTRKKHDASFPVEAIKYCLEQSEVSLRDVSQIIFYDKPLLKFERLLETYLSYAPRGFASFVQAMPVWLKEKLFLKRTLKVELSQLSGLSDDELPPLLFDEHHHSHAASAFYPSPFDEAAVLCLDGVGEWATTSAWHGSGKNLEPLWQIDFPHSLGLLYSAFTYFTGFKVNSGEYKLMGLAPYGEPRFSSVIRDNLIDVQEDGCFRLNMDYFAFATELRMTNERFSNLFDGPPRAPESEITQREMDLAASIQQVLEEVVLSIARSLRQETSLDSLCLAGGVALNCVSNGRLLRDGCFKNIWIQPAAGDAGGALGAAYAAWHGYCNEERKVNVKDSMKGSFLGIGFSDEDIAGFLEENEIPHNKLSESEIFQEVADLLAEDNVVGWFQGRMEFGPRALGGRSILGNPLSKKTQSVMNLKIKYRESFRPFAPSIKAECVSDWFDLSVESPYMLIVANIQDHLKSIVKDESSLFGIAKLNVPRSKVPAITHVDYSARVQTVNKDTNPKFWSLLDAFEAKTGCPMLVNTSFNVRGEPIVCSPSDAYRCFMRTGMDNLVLGNFLLTKSEQPEISKDDSWMNEFELD
ncbi:carbamoyltransferase [Opitutales bacterium]|jgi:carbamoyltransferase|nr:carbamoyltransferase [Opitutales bacterium]